MEVQVSVAPSSAVAPLLHVAALDGVRGAAVALVVIGHVAGGPTGSWIGVDLFFLLSGLLITNVLVTTWAQGHGLRLWWFYVRRARRLVPALVVLGGLYALWVVHSGHMVDLRLDEAVRHLPHAGNLVQIADGPTSPELAHLWSLAAEVQFYAVWPLALAALVDGWRRPGVLVAAVGIAVASAALRTALSFGDAPWYQLFLSPWTRADALFLGAGLGLLVSWRSFARSPRLATHLRALAVPAAVVFAACAVLLEPTERPAYRVGLLVAVVAGALVVGSCVAGGRTALSPVLEAPPLRFLGRVSYSLYLVHLPINTELLRLRPELPTAVHVYASVLLSLVMATASYALVEKPFLRARLPRQQRDEVVVGAAGHPGEGAPGQVPEAEGEGSAGVAHRPVGRERAAARGEVVGGVVGVGPVELATLADARGGAGVEVGNVGNGRLG